MADVTQMACLVSRKTNIPYRRVSINVFLVYGFPAALSG